MFNRGLLHVYYGDGQGKTCAAVGLCVRACGAGCRVLFVQFLKNGRSSELKTLACLAPGVEVLTPKPCVKFLIHMNEQERKQAADDHCACFLEVQHRIRAGGYDLLVLDEAMDAVNLGLIGRELFLAFLLERPETLEIAITGHEMTPGLPDIADYVSEIRKVKHPYDRGVKARVGAEL